MTYLWENSVDDSTLLSFPLQNANLGKMGPVQMYLNIATNFLAKQNKVAQYALNLDFKDNFPTIKKCKHKKNDNSTDHNHLYMKISGHKIFQQQMFVALFFNNKLMQLCKTGYLIIIQNIIPQNQFLWWME